MVYGVAKKLFNNENIMQEHILKYFGFYKQNIGIVLFFRILMGIFRTNSANLLRYVNVISNVLTVLGLYWIYRRINKDKKQNGLLFYILILGFMPISLLSTFVYGDFIGLASSVWAMVFMIKYVEIRKVRFVCFSSLCMAFAIITRSNCLIFIIAMVMYLLFTLKQDETKQEKLIKLAIVGGFLIISFVPNKIITSYISNKYELNDRKEKSLINYLYMGMSEGHMANGWFNDEIAIANTEMQERTKDDKTVENEMKERLKNRVKYLKENPNYTFEFYRDKILSMWTEPTMASAVYNTQKDVDESQNKMLSMVIKEDNWKTVEASQKIITLIIYGGSLICVILKRKNISDEMLLLVLVFLGGFAFHILWEAKSRYVIPYVVILIPVAVSGINELSQKIQNKRKDVKKHEKSISNCTNVLRRRSSR